MAYDPNVDYKAKNIELQKGITLIQWRLVGDVDWINLIAIADLKGADGRGIISFDLINTVGKTKTYRLLYTDATYVDINIIDGNDGNDGNDAIVTGKQIGRAHV